MRTEGIYQNKDTVHFHHLISFFFSVFSRLKHFILFYSIMRETLALYVSSYYSILSSEVYLRLLKNLRWRSSKVQTFVTKISMLDFGEVLDTRLILLTLCTRNSSGQIIGREGEGWRGGEVYVYSCCVTLNFRYGVNLNHSRNSISADAFFVAGLM